MPAGVADVRTKPEMVTKNIDDAFIQDNDSNFESIGGEAFKEIVAPS